jgi:hypothetical protein
MEQEGQLAAARVGMEYGFSNVDGPLTLDLQKVALYAPEGL